MRRRKMTDEQKYYFSSKNSERNLEGNCKMAKRIFLDRPHDYGAYLLENPVWIDEFLEARCSTRLKDQTFKKHEYVPVLPPVYW